ncbi:MAG: hypothetical protein UV78_C0078G0006 [Parcubacteria group bacterium GW2011_GWA2_43_17]|nr:MAG: hypothetical protein UV78_C0078G0006 [Parcubacteria group bacterium GW2011_GWA2_43_17]
MPPKAAQFPKTTKILDRFLISLIFFSFALVTAEPSTKQMSILGVVKTRSSISLNSTISTYFKRLKKRLPKSNKLNWQPSQEVKPTMPTFGRLVRD